MEKKVYVNSTKSDKSYAPLASGIYLNYMIIGMATIIISQYSTNFQSMWHTNLQGISTVLAMIGIGRIVTILFAGAMSDRLGRRVTMLIGMVATIIFLVGLAVSTSVFWASVFALFMGATDSFSDASSYPALTDAFTTHAASMNSLVKAAMSVAQTALPFIVAAVPNAKVTLYAMALVIIIDIVLIVKSAFAPQNKPVVDKVEPSDEEQRATELQDVAVGPKPKMLIDGIALIIIGFTISFTFYVYSQYIPNFGTSVLNVSADVAKSLVSWYAVASLISVFVTSVLVTKIKSIYLIISYSLISLVFLVVMTYFPSLIIARITSVIIGFFAAGGIWQLGLTILSAYFPEKKGKVTGYYSFMTALTYFIGPFVSSFIINSTAASVLIVFKLDILVTLIGIVIISFILARNLKYKFI